MENTHHAIRFGNVTEAKNICILLFFSSLSFINQKRPRNNDRESIWLHLKKKETKRFLFWLAGKNPDYFFFVLWWKSKYLIIYIMTFDINLVGLYYCISLSVIYLIQCKIRWRSYFCYYFHHISKFISVFFLLLFKHIKKRKDRKMKVPDLLALLNSMNDWRFF